MTTKPIYADTLTITEVLIENGSQESKPLICAPDSDFTGAKALRILRLPPGFPVCDITFKGAFYLGEDGNPIDLDTLTFSDGTDTGIIKVQSLTMPMGEGQKISLYAFWFDALNYITINTSVAMSEDVTLTVGLQPIYQGNA